MFKTSKQQNFYTTYLYVIEFNRHIMFLALAYAYCNVSVMPLRKEPFHTSEQTNQLLFGEKVEIVEVNNREWARVVCSWDGYDGWCKQSQLRIIDKKEYRKAPKYLAGSHNDKLVFESGEMWMPYGCDLFGSKGGNMKPLKESGKFKGKKININEAELKGQALILAAMQYIHAPYQWGGRSIAGIDCSGLTQMAFKVCNYALPRDAEQQALQGQLVDFLQNGVCGDLAFFDNKEGKITHVGILIDNQTIIHATDSVGRVVIDKIDQGGIISKALRMRTHNLRFVKRIITT